MKYCSMCAHTENKVTRSYCLNVTTTADLMGPPHNKVGEDSNPQNRAQEGDHKEFSGFLQDRSKNIVLRHLKYNS